MLGFSDAKVEGSTYRVYSLATPFQVIQVAQDMGVRPTWRAPLALRTIAPIAAAAPLLMLVIWCVVSWSRPVKRARAQVAARQPEDLSVSTEGVPDEIRPLLQELNLLLERMRGAFALQKQFVGDAAHELRSPLAALRLQSQALQRAGDPESRRVAEQRLTAGIDRATRLIEQLLSLAAMKARPSARRRTASTWTTSSGRPCPKRYRTPTRNPSRSPCMHPRRFRCVAIATISCCWSATC